MRNWWIISLLITFFVTCSFTFSILSALDCSFVRVHLSSQPSAGPYALVDPLIWESNLKEMRMTRSSILATLPLGVGLWTYESPIFDSFRSNIGNISSKISSGSCLTYPEAKSILGGISGFDNHYQKAFFNDDMQWNIARSGAILSMAMLVLVAIIMWRSILCGDYHNDPANDYVYIRTEQGTRERIKKGQSEGAIACLVFGCLILAIAGESMKFISFGKIELCKKDVWTTSIYVAHEPNNSDTLFLIEADNKREDGGRKLSIESHDHKSLSFGIDDMNFDPKYLIKSYTDQEFSRKKEDRSNITSYNRRKLNDFHVKMSAEKCSMGRGKFASVLCLISVSLSIILILLHIWTRSSGKEREINSSGTVRDDRSLSDDELGNYSGSNNNSNK